jgi:predicted DNA-binding transcriptional regulator AlpA
VLEARAQNADEASSLPVFLSIADLATLTGMSTPTIRRMEEVGEFPPLVNIGARRRALPLRDYCEWVTKRCIAQATAEEATLAAKAARAAAGKSAIEEAA